MAKISDKNNKTTKKSVRKKEDKEKVSSKKKTAKVSRKKEAKEKISSKKKIVKAPEKNEVKEKVSSKKENISKNDKKTVLEESNIGAKKNNHKIYWSFSLRIIGRIFIVILFLLLGTYLLVKAIHFESGKMISYKEKSNVDYNVCLKNNSFYDINCLPKNMKYVANLIDKIQVKFDYFFDIDEMIDINFKYNIDGKLFIKDKNGKIFYEKNYTFLEEKEVNNHDNNIKISEVLDIDYNKYNTVANSFKSSYGIDTESYLIITMKVKKDALNDDDSSIASDSNMYLTIPLSERAIDIELNFDDIDRKSIMIVKERLVFKNTMCLITAGLSIFAGFYVMIKTMRKYRVPNNNKVYDAYIKKILREYDRLIAESKTIISFDNKEIIKVNSFNELLDIHDNLTLPILYYNVTSHVKCYFYITHQNIVYLYTVKASDLEVSNNK